jgi:hypothetical protein
MKYNFYLGFKVNTLNEIKWIINTCTTNTISGKASIAGTCKTAFGVFTPSIRITVGSHSGTFINIYEGNKGDII